MNVTTIYSYDDFGRLITTIGPAHTVDLGGTATSVQGITWMVYNQSTQPAPGGTWGLDATWVGKGYSYGGGPTYVLVNPVAITNTDKDGRTTDAIAAKRTSTSGSGPLQSGDVFNQGDWQSWSSTQYNQQHQKVSGRVYFSIPSTGIGTTSNYNETDYGYDALERQNRVLAPGGTITRTVWTTPRAASVWVGTNDDGATDFYPDSSNRVLFMQAASQSAFGSTVTVTPASNVTAGNTLLAYGCVYNATPTSPDVSDNLGNTWTLVTSRTGANAAAGGAGVWVCHVATGGAMTITFSPGALRVALAVAEYSGVASASPVDVSASATSSTSTTTPAAGSMTTTNAGDLLFGGASQGSTGVIWSSGSGFVLRSSLVTATNMAVAIEDQLVVATGSYNATFSINASAPWTAIGVALKSVAKSTANDMVIVTSNVYDGGLVGKDGTLTQQTQYVDSTHTRVTNFGYDFRDRRTSMTDATSRYTLYAYDNLDRRWQTKLYHASGGNLIGQNESYFDDRNRLYLQFIYAVDMSTHSAGNALATNFWYDFSGNLLQRTNSGDGFVFTKVAYNGVGWVTNKYVGYNASPDYAQATTVSGDTILSQIDFTYDEAGNVVKQKICDRLNGVPGTVTGGLTYASSPKARVSYLARWYDGIDRPIASGNYGVQATDSYSPANTPPASGTGVLVNLIGYDADSGRMTTTTDPAGIINETMFDNAGRTKETVEDSGGLARTTDYFYTPDDLIASMVASNSSTGLQTTAYAYGTTLTDSGVARKDLLVSVTYPDTGVVAYTYNRLGQAITIEDQRFNVRTLSYDSLGRLTDDSAVVTAGTDNSILRISATYEVRGMLHTLISYNASTGGSAVNGVELDYNEFSQLSAEWQNHSGAAVPGTSPGAHYGYDSGASGSNEVRLTSLTYPNTRVITYDYGTAGAINDMSSRVSAVKDGSTSLAAYAYLGIGTVVQIDSDEPHLRLDLWGQTAGVFSGFDNFSRVIDQLWQNHTNTTPAAIDEYKYGYDLNSNRQYKANVVGTLAVSPNPGFDEYYTYDNINRLLTMQRGTLTGGSPPTGITSPAAVEMDWTLDATGNWQAYVTKAAGSTTMTQGRVSSTTNEITSITSSSPPTTPPTAWATPGYDDAGNTTSFPQPALPTGSYTAIYDAWNRIVTVKNATGTTTIAAYQYDGLNRRIVKLAYSGGTLSETRHFYFTNGWQDIEQRVGSSTAMDQQHVWGIRYIDELVCRDRTVSGSNERLYACQDANFNVTALVDTSGTVQQRFLYDPYGAAVAKSPSTWATTSDAYEWKYLFQCLAFDATTGLCNGRYRYYGQMLGRWVQRDPLQPAYKDGANLYEMEGSAPVFGLDPLGLYLSPAHIAMTHDAFVGSGCPGTYALETEIANAATDFESHSDDADKIHTAWHAMSVKGEDIEEAISLNEKRIQDSMAKALANCDTGALGHALHAVQDQSPSGHEGYQVWNGGLLPGILPIPTLSHILGDAFPDAAGYKKAVDASRGLVNQFAAKCCCVTKAQQAEADRKHQEWRVRQQYTDDKGHYRPEFANQHRPLRPMPQ